MRYKIALHQSDEGFSVSAPGLPGCWSFRASSATPFNGSGTLSSHPWGEIRPFPLLPAAKPLIILSVLGVRYFSPPQSDEGFSVSAPGLPGCWSQGKKAEALANFEAAIREYVGVVEDLLEDAEIREIELTPLN